MAEPFAGQITMFAGNWAPRGYAFCDGQLLPISQNDSLFKAISTIYGGDGRTTFALPDLRGRLPVHQGQGPGLTERKIGSKGGTDIETITTTHLPAHTHQLQASTQSASAALPEGGVTAKADIDIYNEETPGTEMSGQAITTTKGGNFHNNLMPFLCVNFIIAVYGFPPPPPKP